MMGFCLSSLTLGEIKLFLKKTSCLSLPAWVAIAWMNHCGVLSTETLNTIPCWIPGILGMGSLCVLLAEKKFFRNVARACAPLFFFIYAVHCLILPYLMPLFEKNVFKVHSRCQAFSAYHLVHHAQAFQNHFFMVIWNGRFSAPAFPEYLFRCKGNDEVIPQ
jgi:ABC-type enterochelin transport system permease subunit